MGGRSPNYQEKRTSAIPKRSLTWSWSRSPRLFCVWAGAENSSYSQRIVYSMCALITFLLYSVLARHFANAHYIYIHMRRRMWGNILPGRSPRDAEQLLQYRVSKLRKKVSSRANGHAARLRSTECETDSREFRTKHKRPPPAWTNVRKRHRQHSHKLALRPPRLIEGGMAGR